MYIRYHILQNYLIPVRISIILGCLPCQDLAVQNSRVEGRAWTWAVQGPSGGCAVAV